MTKLTLVSHHLCPYVQRAAIALKEKEIDFERIYVDLSNKPEWFMNISPLGKVPLLQVGSDETATIFESAVIVEYLEETQPNPLHPSEPIARARHRGWIEFASAILNDIAGLYNAKDLPAFEAKSETLKDKFRRLEEELDGGPYFMGRQFSLVDAAYAPVFRYFDTFEKSGALRLFDDLPAISRWRRALKRRVSVTEAAPHDYAERLEAFLLKRNSYVSRYFA